MGLTKGEDLESTLSDHLLGLGFLGTLQTNDQGDRQLEFLGGLDDTFGDDLRRQGIVSSRSNRPKTHGDSHRIA
jgi:hypothetical protein